VGLFGGGLEIRSCCLSIGFREKRKHKVIFPSHYIMDRCIGNTFIKQGSDYTIDAITEHPIVLLFFGAYWSPPCKKVLDPLKSLYQSANENNKILEIIFISCDFNEQDFSKFTKKMPWVFIPFKEIILREIITRHYEVLGIPSLLLIDKSGSAIKSVLKDLSKENPESCINTLFVYLNETSRSS
jgi:nucleoredoxin